MVVNPSSDIVTTQISYLVAPADGSQAFQIANYESGLLDKGNVGSSTHEVVVENVRGKEHLYTLDNAGFQFLHHPTKCTNFNDPKELEEYGQECTELVREITKAKHVILFSSAQRRSATGKKDESVTKRKPASEVHVDVSPASADVRLHRYAPGGDAAAFKDSRFQIINVWRPIGKTAYDWPLALCTWNSVDTKSDTFTVQRRPPQPDKSEGTEGIVMYNESLGVSYNPNHQWKYVRGMTTDDIVLIKNHDTKAGVAQYTPHTAFEDPTTPDGSPPRESIEMRFVVLYD
ncbi:hypothetical protein L218DRAFT_909323 [Marasmius fiardii PR-910]|nr:hypothetical protein L218DRAFT_909323 [Marasmius fiardii PR-910]